jgi:hypothetical protein
MHLLGAIIVFQLAIPQRQLERPDVAALVTRARAARYQQDSSLAEYRVIARQRMSASIGLADGLGGAVTAVARDRLAARFESVARVGWHHALGAWGEILGARSVVPIIGGTDPEPEDEDAALVLPYYPGRDRLWPISELRDAFPHAEDWIEHPLERGAEALYEYSLGDSLSIRLPDRSVVLLREVRVRPRRPESRLIVGSLWLDIESGALVRAAYRPSVPTDLWPLMASEMSRDDESRIKRFGPFLGIIREIVVEHGLYQRRFWLPRTRMTSAEGTAKGARLVVSITQTFQYEHVAAMPQGSISTLASVPPPDIDERTGRVRRPQWRGVEEREGRCRPRGSTDPVFTSDSLLRDGTLSVMYAEGVRFRVLLPCNEYDLLSSRELPPSIYGGDDELFTETDFNALRRDVERALGITKQAKWEPQPPVVRYGLDATLLRYNRVEGLSAGVLVTRVLGKGYTGSAAARVGLADLEPNGEVGLARSNVRTNLGGSAYRRLAAANDWGNPFGVGASASAALFGRDEGFYYRTLGAELTGTHRRAPQSAQLSWRVFAERQDSAPVETNGSLARVINDVRFGPNIQARAGFFSGASGAIGRAWGVDPRGTRAIGSLRAEAAAGESAYARLASELTVAQGLAADLQGTITAAAGASAGALPAQRLWYLGGAHTVRGHRAGAVAGDAFWLARAELAKGHPLIRPSLFADLGWAGARDRWRDDVIPVAGVGVGASTLDGLVRLDLARSTRGGGRWTAYFYFDPR